MVEKLDQNTLNKWCRHKIEHCWRWEMRQSTWEPQTIQNTGSEDELTALVGQVSKGPSELGLTLASQSGWGGWASVESLLPSLSLLAWQVRMPWAGTNLATWRNSREAGQELTDEWEEDGERRGQTHSVSQTIRTAAGEGGEHTLPYPSCLLPRPFYYNSVILVRFPWVPVWH